MYLLKIAVDMQHHPAYARNHPASGHTCATIMVSKAYDATVEGFFCHPCLRVFAMADNRSSLYAIEGEPMSRWIV
jgi:hypothetical protein